MIVTYSNRTYRITYQSIALVENALGNPNLIQISLTTDCEVKVAPMPEYDINYLPNGEYRSWQLTGINTKLNRKEQHFIYARLERDSKEALLVFSMNDYNVDGTTGEGTTPSEYYYYIKLGKITATDTVEGATVMREVTLDYGYLATPADRTENFFRLRTDANGNEYIITKYHVVSEQSYTSYATPQTQIPSLFEGIPFDNKTIWLNPETKVVEVIGGTGGSDLDVKQMWAALAASTTEQINKSHLTTALSEYATTDSVSTLQTEITKKWTQDDAKIKNWDTAFGWGNHAEAGYAHLALEETFTGLKHFTAGLSVGAGKHKLYEKDGVVYFDGDLAVTGGITQYALGDTPVSTIMDGVAVDGTTISKEGGVLKVIGGGGSSFDSAEMWKLLEADTTEQINRSHLTTALQGYATESWANSNFLGKTDKAVDSDKVDGEHNGDLTSRYWYPTAPVDDLNNYRHNGFAAWSTVSANRPYGYGTLFQFSNMGTPIAGTNDHWVNQIAFGTNNRIYVRQRINTGVWSSWSSLTYLSDNVSSATKLQTPRTIWGKNFDGTNNVSGNMTNVGLINDSIRIEGGFDKATIRGNGHGIIFGGGNGYAHCTYAFRPEWGSQSETQCNLIIQNASAATSNPSYITTHEFVNDGTAYHRTRVRVSRTDGEGSGIYTNTIHASDWFRSEGATGWYAEDFGGGIYMRDSTWIRTYNGKNFKSDGTIEAGAWFSAGVGVNVFNPAGNSWNNGQGAFQTGIPNDGNQTPILVAYNGPANSSSGTNRYFAIEVLNNGTRDVHFCVTGAETVRMRSNWFEVNGNFYATDSVTGRLIYRDVATTGVSAASYFLDNRPAIKCEQDLSVIANDTVRPILRWGDAVSNVGYNTRYVIGSIRQGYDWGRIFMAVSNNDNGTSEGCSFSVYGSGYAAVNGNFLATGGITQYSDQRAKTMIEQISLSLMDIANSPAIRFKWNGWKQKDDGKTHIGGIAQYVQNILPEAIYNSDDVLTMDYATTGYIFAVNTAKHLLNYETKTDKEINKLKKRVKYLEKQLKKLGYEEIGTLDN